MTTSTTTETTGAGAAPAAGGPGDPGADADPGDPGGDDAAGGRPGGTELAAGSGGGAGGGLDDEGGGGGSGGGLSWAQVAALGLALAFLGFAVGLVVTRDRPPAADSADVGFLQDMITHHDQALGVATLEAAYGADPVVRSYARDVITFQSFEIGVMTQILAGWGHTREDRSDEAMAWMDMPVPVADMPGLLGDDDLDRISQVRGAELDALFLEKMAEHHRGGLHMAQEAVDRVGDGDVRLLAQRIERNQAVEINEYRGQATTMGLDLDIPPADVPLADLPPFDG
ncbi:MAG TPA: DUF305 domain-containing protein [Acidimicrobiales bacterium]|nr:DUF305 domain-containing protein [Acidimicrobiales bacterium]